MSVLEKGAKATPKVASGYNHTVALKADGTVWTWGYNSNGQLGLGDTKSRYVPTKVDIEDVIDVEAGSYFSMALKADGTVWTWGQNDKGQLGINSTTNTTLPIQVLGVGGIGKLEKVTKISAEASHWLALLESTEVVACGRNEVGDLGDNTTTNRTTPVYMLNHNKSGHVTDVKDVQASGCATGILKADGTVWVAGHNCQGIIGVGNTNASHVIKQVKDSTGTGTLDNIVQLDLSTHALALSSDGTIWSWGYNNYGQLGINNTTRQTLPVKVKSPDGSGILSNIVKVQTGNTGSLAMAADGTIYSWGYNNYGQRGTNNTTTLKLPRQILDQTGSNHFDNSMLISGNGSHTTLAKNDGTVWTVGYNANGELGDDTKINRQLVQCISNPKLDVNEKYLNFATVGETKKIEVKLNRGFNLYMSDTKVEGNIFTSYDETVANVDQQGNVIAVGAGSTYVKIENKDLGLTTTVKIVVADREGTTRPKVVGGANHYVALKANGSVFTWGYNGNGQLGLGNTVNQTSPVYANMDHVIDVAAGANFTAVLKEDGTVWTVGQNNYGQLGQNNTTGSNSFVPVKAENGIGNLTDVISITANNYYMAALKKDGTVYAWGYNGYGQLGNSSTTTMKLPTKVRKLNNIMAIAAGVNHLVLLDSDSSVWTTGRNNYGQLAQNNTTNSNVPVKMLDGTGTAAITGIKAVAAGVDYTVLLGIDGKVYSVGYNNYGQLADGTTTRRMLPILAKDTMGNSITDAKEIMVKQYISGIIRKAGKVYTAGYNEYGSAGNGSKTTNKMYTQMLGEFGKEEFENGMLIAATNNSSLVANTVGKVYTTGYNGYGQLGDGTKNTSSTLIGISNDSLEVEEPIIVMNHVGDTKDIKAHMNLGFNILYQSLASENYTYESFNKNIATVDNKGTITAEKYGNARMQVTSQETGKKASVIVKILREGDITNPKVESGNDYSVALKSNGEVYAWGYNGYGQLGIGDTVARSEPTKLEINNVIDIVCGNNHTLYLKQDGTVWASGLNNYGQLGDNTTTNRTKPVKVLDLENIIKIEAGANHSIVLKSDGTVYSFGYNSYGGLGDTTTTRRSKPVQVKRLQNVKEIAAGGHSSLALDIDGKVWAFGYNTSGQLGLGTRTNVLVPTMIPTISNIQEIDYGNNFGVAVSDIGEVYTFGVNGNGQLGLGNTTAKTVPTKVNITNIEKIATGGSHVLAKAYDGTAYGWGLGTNYQFGNELNKVQLSPIQIKYSGTADAFNQVLEVSSSTNHSVIVKEDGSVWTTGKNNYGQLGDNTNVIQKAWVCISEVRIKVPQTSITIPEIGANYNLKPELDVGFNLLYDSMSNGNYQYTSKNTKVATVDSNGIITGQKQGKTKIGITETNTNKTIYVEVTVLAKGDVAFPQVETNEYSTVALKADGTVWTWGQNTNGELGLGNNSNQIAPCKVDIENVQKIAVGLNHVLALKADGTVWSWGRNNYGQLGTGDTTDSNLPVKVRNASDIKEISAGNSISMAVSEDGKLYTWGLNNYGQLGIGSKTNQIEPTWVRAIENISKVAAGNRSGYALTQEGKLYSFGYNTNGQLGDGTTTTRTLPVEIINITGGIDIVASTSDQAYCLKDDGTVWGWGYANLGALTDVGGAIPKQLNGIGGRRMENISSIGAGYYAAVAITDEGKAISWGLNGYGGLGNGTTTNNPNPSYVKDNLAKDLSQLLVASMGKNYSMYAKEDGSVWATGYNHQGQLGNMSKANINLAENISNDFIRTDSIEMTINGIDATKKINASYQNGFNLYNRESSNAVNYLSANEAIATVDQAGNVTGKAIGKTYLHLSSNGLARRIEVNVLQEDEIAVMDLKAGNKHTIGLKTNGTLWSFGANNYGQLGIKTMDNETRVEPEAVTGIPEGLTFTKIAVGKDHSLALGTDGKVYAWGANNYGQLGNGTTTNSGELQPIVGLENIEKIVAYENISYAIDKEGNAYVWGEGYTKAPQKITFFARIIDISGNYLLSEYGTVWNLQNLEEKVPSLTNITEIAAGNGHGLALNSSGKVLTWGNNSYGQLGDGTTKERTTPKAIENLPEVESVKASGYSSYLLTKQGEIYSFGRNTNQSLGLDQNYASVVVPTKLEIAEVERISAGQNYGVAVTKEGFSYSWGANNYGQLGLEHKEETRKPTLIGDVEVRKDKDKITIEEGENITLNVTLNNTFNLRQDVVASDGFELKAINKDIVETDASGTILGKHTGLTTVVAEHQETKKSANVSVEVLKKDYKSVVSVVSGKDFSVGLKADGTVWKWQNIEEPEPIEIDKRVVQIVAGTGHIAILTEEGKVYTIGENLKGQLGHGSNTNQKDLVTVIDDKGSELNNIVRISAKGNTTYAQDGNGNLYAFGENYYNVATKVQDLEPIAEMIENYAITKENKVIDLSTKQLIAGLDNIIKIAKGNEHTLFLTQDKTVYAMGQNGKGQCGIGTKVNCMTPTLVKNNIGTDILRNVKDITAGDNYSIVVLEDGTVYGFGANTNQILGTEQAIDAQVLPRKNNNINDVMLVSSGNNHVSVAKNDGKVYTWGNSIEANSVQPVQIGKEQVVVNTNHVTIEKGQEKALLGNVKAFNLIKDLNNETITYETKDNELVQVEENTGKLTAVDRGKTAVIVKQAGTDNFAIVQVEVIKENTAIKPDIQTCNSHQLILRADGTVWTYGENNYGQLGAGNVPSNDNVQKISFENDVKIVQIAVGENISVALDENGQVWTWGRNDNYQLGNNSQELSNIPVKVELPNKVVKIAAGYHQVFAITEENRLYAWGLNTSGELGVGNTDSKVLPTLIENRKQVLDVTAGKTHTVLVTTTGEVYTTGNNSYSSLTGTQYKRNTFEKAEGLEKIAYIEAGEYHNFAVTTDNKLYTWGLNLYGQLGIGNLNTVATPVEITNISKVQEISAGRSHTLITTKEGKMYATGSNTLGQLGKANQDSISSLEEVATLKDVYEVAAGNTYSMAITKDGKVYGWGDYYHGTTDIRTKTNSSTPVQVGNDTFKVKENEMVIPINNTQKVNVQDAFELNVWEDKNGTPSYTYSTINDTIAGVDENGNVTAKEVGITWIKVINNITSEQQIIVVKVVPDQAVTYPQITSGKDFAINLKVDGSIWSFGYNSNGELGNNSYVGSNVPQSINIMKSYTKIKSGEQFSLAMRKDGTLWAWGNNTYGQLGQGDRNTYTAPTAVNVANTIKIAAGANHAVALNQYGEVYVWGNNLKGQLGKDITAKSIDIPTKLDLKGETIVEVGAGNNTTVLVTEKGKVIIYGSEAPEVQNAVKAVAGNEIIVLTKDGNVQKVGTDVQTIYTNQDAIDVEAQNGTYMILTKEGKVYTFGDNTYGQLALGNNTNSNTPTEVNLDKKVIDIGSGWDNTYIITQDGLVYGAGKNTYSNLGNEQTKDSNTYTLVGKQDFTVDPESIQMSVNDEKEIGITSERYNVFGKDERTIEDYNWTSNDDTIVTLLEAGKIKALAEGETTITIEEKETGASKEIKVVVVPLEANRLDKIAVNDVDAKVSGTMKYEVILATDDLTGNLILTTKDETDKLSIDNGTTWYENGTLTKTVDLPQKETIIPILLETENGTRFTYELKVIKQSNVIDLSKLTVNEEEATAISSTEYIAFIEDVDNAHVKVETLSDVAKVGIDNEEPVLKTVEKDFTMKDLLVKTLPIKVISESGKEIDYTLTIYKKSAIYDLEKIEVDGIEATKDSFTTYSIVVPRETTSVEVTATALYELAGVEINHTGEEQKQATRTIALEADKDTDTTVKIDVIVDGVKKQYTLNIHRKEDATGLAYLYVNGTEIKPVGNQYEAYVATNQNTAEVTAIAGVETSKVQIGINAAEEGRSTVTVSTTEESNVYTIIVTDGQDPTKVATYQLTIKKPSGNNNLKSVTVGNEEINLTATKQVGTNTYKVSVNEKYKDLKIVATAEYNLAEVAIADHPYKQQKDEYQAHCPDQTYQTTIYVKAQNGEVEEYTLIIEKTSSNTELERVMVDGKEATKSDVEEDTYEITLDRPLDEVEVKATMKHEQAQVALNNILYEVHEITKNITMDAKDITVTINTKAEDGTTKTYYLKIYGLPDNTNLQKITVQGNQATKVPYTNRYEVKANKTLTDYEVKVELEDKLAKVKIGEGAEAQGMVTTTVTKTGTKTIVNITVTAQDQKTTEEYVLEISEMSDNNRLSFVKVNNSVITVNEAGQYYAKVAGDAVDATVNVETEEENAKVGITLAGVSNKLEETLNLPDQKNTFTITVVAEDGTTNTYPLILEKMSTNAELDSIYVDGTKVEPVDGVYTYKIGNANSVSLKAVAKEETSFVGIDGQENEKHESTRTISVTEEQKKVEVIVTAEDGTSRKYEVNLEKYASDNSLLKLSAEGVTEDKITQTGENSYQIVVSNELTALDLTAETSSEVAKVKIGTHEYEVNTTTKNVMLPNDTTQITITVQAENGEEREYQVNISKQYVLTIDSITINDTIKATYEEDGWVAWIDKDTDLANVVVVPTSSKVKVDIENIAQGTGTTSFSTPTTTEETIVKIKLTSPIENDEVEYTLRIMKKSSDTELEYVKVDNEIGILEDDEYVVKVPIQTTNYEMEVKTVSKYAKVKIENHDYQEQKDTMSIDLNGIESKQVTVTVEAQDGTTKTYLVTIQKVSQDNTLQQVTVNGVEIKEDNGTYLAFVKEDLASVPVTITTTHEKAKIRINKEETEVIHTVSRTENMTSTEITLDIEVTAEDGGIRIYKLSIMKESADTGLEWIKVDGKVAIEIEENVYYQAATPGASLAEIIATTTNQYAKVKIGTNEESLKQSTVNQALTPENKIISIPIVVTAQNGKDTKTYTLKIEQVSNDTSLAEVKVNGTLVTNYDTDTKTYEIIMDNTIEEATVYAKTTNEEASVKIDTNSLEKHETTAKVSTPSEDNIYPITVVAEDGTTEERQLNIKKLSQDASLVKLYVNGEEIEVNEDGTYTAEVLESLGQATVRVKAGNNKAAISINNQALTNLGEDELELSLTARTIKVPIQITAEDNSIVKNYTLTIHVVSDNKELEYIKVNGTAVINYNEDTHTYYAFIPADSDSAKIEAKTVSDYATTNINSTAGTNTITYTAGTEEDVTEVKLDVIAENDSVRTYTIVLQKIATDNTLAEVKKDGEIVECGEDGIYKIEVPEGTTKINLYAKATNEYAEVSIDGQEATLQVQEKEITLEATKTTTVIIQVTSQSGVAQNYTVAIEKISAETGLEYIKVDNAEVTNYDVDTKTYHTFIPATSTSASIEVKAKDAYATVLSGEEQAVQILSFTETISSEKTQINITITAENGDTEEYILILQKISTDHTIKEIYVDGTLITPDEEGNYVAKVVESKTDAKLKVVANNEYAEVQIEAGEKHKQVAEETIALGNDKLTEVNGIITSQNGEENPFKVTIEKVSDDAGINTILIDGIVSTTYDADNKTYTAYIDEDNNLTNVSVMANSSVATVILEDVSEVGSAQKDIATTQITTKVSITVKAESGKIENYTLEIIKKSSDATIHMVQVNEVTIEEPYEATIKKLDTTAKVTIKATNKNAIIKLGDEPEATGEITVIFNTPLEQDIFTIPVVITSQDGKNTKSDTITIRRQSNNTQIAKITINGEEVDLSKEPNYEAIVKNEKESDIVITLADSNASVALDEGTASKGQLTTKVATPGTTIRTIKVTAEDGTTKEYQITLTKKFTISGKIIDEFIGDEHIANITTYLSDDTRKEGDSTNPREVIDNIQTKEDGTYEIILEPGLYDIVISKSGYLNYRVTKINLNNGEGVLLDDISILGGDVIQTGEIQLDDLVAINDNYGTITEENKEEKAKFDLNGDGKIDSLDRNILKKNYGKKEIIIEWVDPKVLQAQAEEAARQEALKLEKERQAQLAKARVASAKGGSTATGQQASGLILPLKCKYSITSEYGTRKHPVTGVVKKHSGIDLGGTHHAEVYAVADGEVTFAGVQKAFGNCVEIKHTVNGKTIYSFYAHLSKINVKAGQKVTQGEVIGLEGGDPNTDPNPGSSTGHHLHFEIRKASGYGNDVNPHDYLNF